MRKIYVVNLTDEERTELRELTKKGSAPARKLARAHILLHAAEGRTDQEIAEALHLGRATVERTRKRFVEGNLEAALSEAPRPGAKRKLDGKQEALLLATACSTPPSRMLAGPCNCLPTNWLNSRLWTPSRTRRYAAR